MVIEKRFQCINIYYKFVGTVEILEDLCYTKNADYLNVFKTYITIFNTTFI